MSTVKEWEWENIEPGTQKMKVPGGYVLNHHYRREPYGCSQSSVFIPDPPAPTVRGELFSIVSRPALKFSGDGFYVTVLLDGEQATNYALSIPYDLTTAIRRK